MIKLYGLGLSNNVNKVRYCLNHLGLEYEWEQTNPMQGENKTDDYLEMAPSGKIPAIDIDGFKLFESNAINRYLATINNSSLYPQDPKQRATIDAWSDFVSIHIQMAMGRVLFNRMMAPMLGAEVDEGSVKAGLEFLDKFLPACEKQLGKTKFIAGDQLTTADINLLAVLDPFELMQESLDKYSNITKWRKQLMSEDFYTKCYNGGNYSEFVQAQMAAMAQGK